jgi:hypothetical protein
MGGGVLLVGMEIIVRQEDGNDGLPGIAPARTAFDARWAADYHVAGPNRRARGAKERTGLQNARR